MFIWGLQDGFYAHCCLKMCYVGVLGYTEKCINFTGMFFKSV